MMFPTARTSRPILRGKKHAISTRKPQATQIGDGILRAGGNAFDAAVATMGALAVTDPSMTGFGGDAFVLVYSAREGKVISINAGGPAPMLATIDWYREHAGGKIPVNDGLLSASFPSVLDACYLLLGRWGSMTFGELLEPSIQLADEGFPVSEYLADFLAASEEKLRKYPTTERIYFLNGRTLSPGDILRNPDLARTLRRIVAAERGASGGGRAAGLRAARDYFYKGDIARELAAFSEASGGLYRYQDFARFSAKVEEPVSINYRGWEVYKNASATQGPLELILLNLVEELQLSKLGHNSVDAIHLCVEAAKLAYADREQYLGDADFLTIPFDVLLSKQYARERRALIDRKRASLELRPGRVDGRPLVMAQPEVCGAAEHSGDTSYMAIVDGDRNAVSFTPSLHSAFGTGVVMGDTGLIFNCRGDFFELDPRHPNALAPGKRTRSTLTPTLVLKAGKPCMVLGSPGGDDQPQRIAQTFLNVVEFGMNIQEAIEAPRWSTTSFPASEFPHTMYPGRLAVEERIPGEVREALAARGHVINVNGAWTLNASCAILIREDNGVLEAGADPRGDSYALAY
jgi:gamma-glutamyltranspeptidase/glutathione hydrolase